MKLLLQVLIGLYFLINFIHCKSKYYDGPDRPYKFGYSIEGNQHRQESKDANGIIMGEFGFITADGVYHVTGYGTDENGNFKILYTKNIKIGLPGEPGSQPAPKSLDNSNPVSASPPRASSQPQKKLAVKLKPASNTASCSNCLIPKKEPEKSQQKEIPQLAPAGVTLNNGNSKQNQINSDNKVSKQPILNSRISSDKGKGSARAQSTVSGPKNTQGTLSGASQIQLNEGIRGKSQIAGGPIPSKEVLPSQNQQSLRGKTASSNRGQTSTSSTGQRGSSIKQSNNFNEKIVGTTGLNSLNDNEGNQILGQVPLGTPGEPGSQGVSKSREGLNGKVGNEKSSREKLKSYAGLSDTDLIKMSKILSGILYKFNYTVGYHGHNEQGDAIGAKDGGYFFVGRDGLKRIVDYTANEFGFQPHIKLEKPPSADVPREETEKEAGLKGYEFKWFNLDENRKKK